MAISNQIKFPLPADLKAYWQNTSIRDRFEDDYLTLRVHRNNYSRITQGSGVTLKRAYTTNYSSRETKLIGFRLTVRNQSEDLYLCLKELAEYTAGTGCNTNIIDVIDYVGIESREDRDRGYRIRKGIFTGEFGSVSGSNTLGYVDCQGQNNITGDRYGTGFSFKFMEVDTAGYF